MEVASQNLFCPCPHPVQVSPWLWPARNGKSWGVGIGLLLCVAAAILGRGGDPSSCFFRGGSQKSRGFNTWSWAEGGNCVSLHRSTELSRWEMLWVKIPSWNRKTALNKMSPSSPWLCFPWMLGQGVGGSVGKGDEMTSLLSWLWFLAVPQCWAIPHSGFHAGYNEKEMQHQNYMGNAALVFRESSK